MSGLAREAPDTYDEIVLRLTRNQAREVDRIAIEDLGIPGIVLMENAARGAVDAIADLLTTPKDVVLVCGGGNNGGDGLAVARHLLVRGHHPIVMMTVPPNTLNGDAAGNLNAVQKLGVTVKHSKLITPSTTVNFSEFDLVIDAVFGTGLNRAAAGAVLAFIRGMQPGPGRPPVVSLDIPSGLDCDTGRPLGECVRANRTITFAAEKAGFVTSTSREFTGAIAVVDIGVPRLILERAVENKP